MLAVMCRDFTDAQDARDAHRMMHKNGREQFRIISEQKRTRNTYKGPVNLYMTGQAKKFVN